jgi:beta-glucanase (GH16 family)
MYHLRKLAALAAGVMLAVVGLAALPAEAAGTTYYVSPAGNDSNNGTSPSTPWRTAEKVNSTTFNGGDAVLFEGGKTFTGSLTFTAANVKSTPSAKFTVGAYGTGKPTITSTSTGANSAAVMVNGVSGFVLQDCILRPGPTSARAGVWIQNSSSGAPIAEDITVQRCDVGGFHYAPTDFGAEIFITGYPGSATGAVKNVKILSNTLHGLNGPTSPDDNGIAGWGNGKNILDVTYRGNLVYDIGGSPDKFSGSLGNGILSNGVNGGTVEHNIVHDVGANTNTCGGPGGIWAVSSNAVTIQFNEVYKVRPANGTYPGKGCDWVAYDLDFDVTNSYVQYNYSHDNFGSALLAYSSGTWGNNTYRFNVSERDGNGDATYGGSAVTITHSPAQPIKIYNNTFYIDGRPTTGNKKTYALLSNNGSKITLPAGSVIGNNIFSITPQSFYGARVAPYMYFPYGLSGGVINNNVFHSTATTKEWRIGGTAHASLADYRAATGYDSSSKESDPLLVSPGQGGTLSWTPSLGNGPQPEPADYKLNSGSPALGAGMSITNAGARDYYGNALASPVNIGAHDAASQAGNQATAQPQAGTSFIEHFDGPLDTSFWYISDGYNNGSHQNCQFNKNNVNVANGILSLSITNTPYGDRDYSCGSIQTNQKYAYGTYETRMKVGKASGTNSSLFTYAGPYQGVPQSHEIDFETLGKDTTRTEVNSWVNGDPKGPAIVDLGLENSEQFVNLAFEWTADKLTFYVNGVAKYSFTGDDVPYEPQLVIPMIWSTDTLTSWMGPFEYPGRPIVTQYSVISYTAPGDPCQWSGSIVC